ncbi:MAG: transporter, family, multidrug resistance protein [Frankiales bacterium]|jgi:MFS family permease|nr:transporter, family, multidrug resistance protein [Frankiales bacterium]MDX6212984.1 transporter, family, multidrug resistance protein [Frankiales bacterium]
MRRPEPLKGLPREVGVLVAVAFAVAVGFGIVAPAIPVFARSFDVSRGAAGAVISAFALARLLFALTSGRLVDRFGERLVMAVGIGIVAVSSALAGLAQSYAQLLLLRGAGGVGSAMFTVSAYSLLLRTVPAGQRGRASGVFSGGFLLGGITGPALGGLVTGWNIRAPFFAYAGTLAVAGSIGLFALRSTALRDRESARAQQPVALAKALRNRSYVAALAANLADSWAVLGIRSALIPLFVGDILHKSPGWTGLGFVVVAAVNAATLFPAGRYADSYGRKPVMVAGCLASAAAITVLAVVPNAAGYLLAMAVFGFGSGLLDVAPAAVVGDVAGGRGGRVVAAYQMSGDTGVILGPLIAGHLADVGSHGTHPSYALAFGVTAAVLAFAGLVALTAPESRQRTDTGEGAVLNRAVEPAGD